MRMMNSVVTRLLAAGLALGVWGSTMRHLVALRHAGERQGRDVRLAA